MKRRAYAEREDDQLWAFSSAIVADISRRFDYEDPFGENYYSLEHHYDLLHLDEIEVELNLRCLSRSTIVAKYLVFYYDALLIIYIKINRF